MIAGLFSLNPLIFQAEGVSPGLSAVTGAPASQDFLSRL
ncbi:MAG: hypothetical protein PWP47_1242 [Synergistaceae bacterium]|jgi:hypothetical protein|nr:hypothetical protein [Synergistaceae bacterium]